METRLLVVRGSLDDAFETASRVRRPQSCLAEISRNELAIAGLVRGADIGFRGCAGIPEFPGNASTTTSPGFNAFPAVESGELTYRDVLGGTIGAQ